MTDVQQQVNHLNRQIDSGAEETKSYLDQLKKKVTEYDQEHKLSESASSYLGSGIETAQSSVDELKTIGAHLKEKSKDASDETIRCAQKALGKTKESLEGLQAKAREYDAKFHAKGSKGSSITRTVEEVVNATRQKTMDVIEMANEQAMRVLGMIQNMAGHAAGNAKYGAQVVAGESAKVADTVDEKLGVTPMATGAIHTVKETVVNLDKRMGVSQTAAKIDEKVTGGLGAKVVNKAGEIVSESIEYVTESLHQAKIVASGSSTAQAVDEKVSQAADTAADVTGKVGESASHAKEQVKNKAGQVQEKAMEMAGQAQDKAKNMATSAKETGSSMTEGAKQQAGYAADKASEKGTQAKEGAQHLMGKAHEKGVHGMGYAKDTASSAAGSAQQKGSELAQGAKETGSHAMGTAKQKGHEAKEMGQERAHQTKEGTQQMTGLSPNKDKSTMETHREGAHNVGTSAKEAMFGMSSGQSATDERANQKQQHQAQSMMEQAAQSAAQAADQAKEKMADVSSRAKSVMKESTKA